METKSDDERIVVNGGCFPLHWVRKFYNIETNDIQDGAVTEAKLNEDLANKIEQAIANLQLAWDATSGKVTVMYTNGESAVYTLAPATTSKAGIMSAEDKGKVENAVKDVTLATAANSMSLTMTKSGEAASTVVNIPIVTDSVAGVMSAEMLQALKTAFCIIGGVRSKDDVTIHLTDLAGITHGYVIQAASTTYAGVMSAEDKIKLDGLAVKSIDIEDIDTIPASIEDAAVMAIDTSRSRYILTYGNINVGAIDIFSDNLGHQLTEVLTTHYEMTSGDVEPSHSDVEVYTYYRSYNINSFELARKGVARGTWSEWQQCVEELTNEELEKILN